MMNLQTEKEYTVEAGENNKPLGSSMMILLRSVPPGDRIRNFSCTDVWSGDPQYRQSRIEFEKREHVLDVFIEDNLLTMNRVARNEKIIRRWRSHYIHREREPEVTMFGWRLISQRRSSGR